MDIPNPFHVEENKIVEDNVTALCMLLRRLAYPSRLKDMQLQFGWEGSRVSRITRSLMSYILDRWRHLLLFDSARLSPETLQRFADAISARGSPVKTIWGFIDGTLRKIARPVRNQRIVYNGWKRIHALKFHSLLTPDGLHVHVYGPIEGRRHDQTLYRQSGLHELLAEHSWSPDGDPMQIYGDPAYGLETHLFSPYKSATLTEDQKTWNYRMSRVREAVEWGFGEVTKTFPFLDFSKNHKILLNPSGAYYLVGILLCNAHTILHRPQAVLQL